MSAVSRLPAGGGAETAGSTASPAASATTLTPSHDVVGRIATGGPEPTTSPQNPLVPKPFEAVTL